ncbi:trehalose utilization protein ThuA [Paenibacillus polymyxa]|nr:ThuA domain-containing protein [Paenibacillus polymyxa]OBA05608.1 trehalose utilization protein ThuA [Paenibacillus polymyxa]
MINVTIWNEFLNEKLNDEAKRIYPNGIHQALADGLADEGFTIRTATLRDDAEHGLGEEILNSTDVLLWWGHKAHDQVSDEVTARVVKRVQEGMGLIVLHSGHFSKPFKALMGTSCDLKWRVAGEQEIIWSVNPSHPIVEGIDAKILLAQEEMYGEFFDIPTPDELVFVSNFEGGEVFRTGCTFYRGNGKIFYFRPGHETYPTYYQPDILKVIANSIRWASPTKNKKPIYGRSEPVRPLGRVLV